MNFFIGLVITIISALLVIKTDWLVSNFGHMAWAESKLGMFGGTRTLIKVIGVVFAFIGLMTMVGLQETILGWIAGFLIPNQLSR
jgi:hypothetical protein